MQGHGDITEYPASPKYVSTHSEESRDQEEGGDEALGPSVLGMEGPWQGRRVSERPCNLSRLGSSPSLPSALKTSIFQLTWSLPGQTGQCPDSEEGPEICFPSLLPPGGLW